LSLLGLCACSAAKKPAPEQNKTIIVPEVSRVSFDTVDLKSAPKEVRDIAKIQENQEAASWVQAGGKAFFIVSGGERSRAYDISVDEILQRIPGQNVNWIDVKLKYKKRGQPRAAGEPYQAVVRADLPNAPGGVGFSFSGFDPGPGTGGQTAKTTPPAPAPAQQAGAVLEQPTPNQVITSPVKIKGTVTSSGQKRVRLTTRGGQIIKEEPLNPGNGGGFDTSLSYSAPEMATPGQLAILDVSGGGEKVLATVSVMIK
jgi:hypothetical protein